MASQGGCADAWGGEVTRAERKLTRASDALYVAQQKKLHAAHLFSQAREDHRRAERAFMEAQAETRERRTR